MDRLYKKIERTVGGLKFAVIIILVFTILMIIGTFLESWYGTDYANRIIYKTPIFMGVQFLMMLSIIFATLIRLPIKKRLYGFYVIHSGLIIIGIGSFTTYVAGIDGSIYLAPLTPSREIILNDDIIEIHNKTTNKLVTLDLPYSAFEKNINVSYGDIEVKNYLPFARNIIKWTRSQDSEDSRKMHSSSYAIYNENVREEFILSLNPEASEFKTSLTLGALNIVYLPKTMFACFEKNLESGLIIWNYKEANCKNIEEMNLEIKKTSSGKRFFAFKEGKSTYSFIPDVYPWALNSKLEPILDSPFKVLSKNVFRDTPYLFLFGDGLSYYSKEEGKWITKKIVAGKEERLPWMNFNITLTKNSNTLVPKNIPVYTRPIQENGQLINGDIRAANIRIQDKNLWVTNNKPIETSINGELHTIYLTKKSKILPYELVLTKFKMKKDPGTNNPASYESFVKKITNDGTTNHHIFMNNPLKHDGITFYQASYSQNQETGEYSSTLTVNVDQGRFLKYLGSIFLVLGSIWHFVINNKKKKLSN